MYTEDTRGELWLRSNPVIFILTGEFVGIFKMFIRDVAVCDHRNKCRGFHFIVMHYNESSRRVRGSELTMLLSPQVHGVRIIADLR